MVQDPHGLAHQEMDIILFVILVGVTGNANIAAARVKKKWCIM